MVNTVYTSTGNFPVCYVPGMVAPGFVLLIKYVMTMYAMFHVWFAE